MPDPDLGASRPLVPPLYPAAVYTLPDLDALDAHHGRRRTRLHLRPRRPPQRRRPRRAVSTVEAPTEPMAWGLVTGSGMGAITATLLSLLQSGDRVVASNQLYGRTAQFLEQELSRFGVRIDWVDATDVARRQQGAPGAGSGSVRRDDVQPAPAASRRRAIGRARLRPRVQVCRR